MFLHLQTNSAAHEGVVAFSESLPAASGDMSKQRRPKTGGRPGPGGDGESLGN